jgi:glycosyltransferase involved in cell wall biosynthesis
MMKVSGFTFIHNALEGGYPIVEAIEAVEPYVDEIVIVDMQSTDGTRELLERLPRQYREPYIQQVPIRIIDGRWGNQAGETLRQAHNLYTECQGDIIIHFEADEVYDDSLIRAIRQAIDSGTEDIAVHRLQLEQNFQRCRWYPEPVHRVFSKYSNTLKEGHTTNRHTQALILEPENGFLWDITNCFRDNYLGRIEAQAELWSKESDFLMTPVHCLVEPYVDKSIVDLKLQEKHWIWTQTPFAIPERLQRLVGMTEYKPEL